MDDLLRGLSKTLMYGLMAAVIPAALAQTVTITPGYTTIGLNQTVQYTAAVTGLMNTAVSWKVNNVVGGNSTIGTISNTGLYTAPATVPTVSTLVEALASDNKTLGVQYVVVEPPGPAITSVSPSPAPTGNSTITINGSAFGKSVQVMVNGAVMSGTKWLSSTTLTQGVYVGKAGPVPIQLRNPGTLWGPVFNAPFVKSGPALATTISPASVSVNLGATQPFTSNNATTWSATAGTITPTGFYTAPAVMPASGKATVTATGPGGSANATVTLINPNAQQISPVTVTLNLGAPQQFTSTGATSWTAVSGKVTSTGLYTAPSTFPSSGTDTVTATGPGGIASATVTLRPPAPSITGVGTNPLPLGLFSTTVTGTGFVATSVASLNGSPLTTSFSAGVLTVSGFAAQSGQQNLTVANGSSVSAPFSVQIGNPNAVVSAAAARRFLERATFGPSPSDASNVQTIGPQAWVAQQFSMPQISDYNSVTGSQGGMPQQFLTNAVMNADQLRQRVAFALSEIFVTSLQKLIWNGNMVTYQNMLLADAFTNYRQIMEGVTLSSAMGQYLDMANNAKAVPGTDAVANENYARELMQLFTIGTKMLNPDGSAQVDATNTPIPTYSQFTVTEFARVFTGWTYAPAPGGTVEWGSYINGYGLAPVAAFHDSLVSPGAPAGATGPSKYLLAASPVGSQPPTSLTPQQDLDNALDNIFNHPNVGPFVGQLLIKQLVKSNPSPGYISRVAAAFNGTNGAPRGDMKNLITAILLDPEATANDNGGNDQPYDGHLQEHALFIPAIFRAFGGTMSTQNYFGWDLVNMSQDIFDPPSVFNYYSPSYHVAGVKQSGVPVTNLTGPEFQIFSPSIAVWRANMVGGLFGSYSNPVLGYGPGTSIDLTPFVSLAANPTTLVNALDLTLTHGVMPAAMKSEIVAAVTANSSGSLSRVETACYLILTSTYYNVWH
jgi:uncharacterized protein (DUF1800 family)